MEGFLVTDYADRFDAARAEILGWVADGRLRVAVDVIEGLDRAPEGLRGRVRELAARTLERYA